MAQLMMDFPAVSNESEQMALLRLMEEGLDLQTEYASEYSGGHGGRAHGGRGMQSARFRFARRRSLFSHHAAAVDAAVFKRFPLRACALGTAALLHHRFGHVITALQLASECIEAASNDRLARFCFPLVFVVAKLLPILRGASRFAAVHGGAHHHHRRSMTPS